MKSNIKRTFKGVTSKLELSLEDNFNKIRVTPIKILACETLIFIDWDISHELIMTNEICYSVCE